MNAARNSATICSQRPAGRAGPPIPVSFCMPALGSMSRGRATTPAPDCGRRGIAGWMARLRGFEPPTPSSGGWCSDPLSYRRVLATLSSSVRIPPVDPGVGRGEWIRTTDPLLPKQMRYQAALRPADEDSIPAGCRIGSVMRSARRRTGTASATG